MEVTMTTTVPAIGAVPKDDYRYEHFTLPLMLRDLRFGRDALRPGDAPPDIALSDLDGTPLSLSRLLSAGPTVLVTGSLTCPMTSSSTPLINGLYEEFQRDFQFVMLYVREAHPGERLLQPESLPEKAEHAARLKSQLGVEPRVVVDDLDGTLHRLLDGKPNAAFVFDSAGRLAYRSLWASDQAGLREALVAIREGRVPPKRERTRMMAPMLRAIGSVAETMSRGGRRAHGDLLRAMPPMELTGLLASAFRPLPKALRGLAAITTMMALSVAAAVAVVVAI
jgi:hypothetical protein